MVAIAIGTSTVSVPAVPAVPAVTAVTAVSSIPTIPTIPAVPAVSSIPTIPTIPVVAAVAVVPASVPAVAASVPAVAAVAAIADAYRHVTNFVDRAIGFVIPYFVGDFDRLVLIFGILERIYGNASPRCGIIGVLEFYRTPSRPRVPI